VASIRSQSKTANRDSIAQVARTAAGGNSAVARIMVEAFAKAGRDGVVVIEQGKSLETTLDVQEGMNFDRGFIDASLLLKSESQECILEDAYILVHDLKISMMRELLPLLEMVAALKKPLLIIAEDVEGEALATLIVNRQKGSINCIAVKAPGYADRRRALLQDIAVLSGATAITFSSGRTLAMVTLDDLGRARRVIVKKNDTTILGGAGESNVAAHVQAIREELSRTTNSFET
jgi:chaperonin GroEL